MRVALSAVVAVLAVWSFAVLQVNGGEDFPSPETILHKVAERARSQRTMERSTPYTCTRETLTENFDRNGNVRERKVKVGQTHSRPGGAAEAEKWTSEQGVSLDEELLRRFQFRVTAREIVEGRSTLVLTFVTKDPPAPIRRLQDRVLNRAIGTIWVDEAEFELARAEITLGEPVSFGILGAIHAFSFSFVRERTQDGNWLTRWTDTTVNARKFLSPIQTRKRVEWSDFKKLAAQ